MSHQLEYDTDTLPEALVARLRGDVDMAVTPDLGEALLVAVEEHSAGCLVVDLGAVDYVDSSGIELLFRLHAALTRRRLRPDRGRSARLQRGPAARAGGDERHRRGAPDAGRGARPLRRPPRDHLTDRVPSVSCSPS